MADSNQKVICVAGMHRSGTSMIARLLNLCGMDLGPEQDMMPPSPANPEGYWEHIWFNYYNNEILTFFKAAWDFVPVLPDNWTDVAGLEWVRREAAAKIATFASPVWGWKDPRNCITLPFWKTLLPGMKTVICLRNPLDVANSLNKRGSSSPIFGLQLWWQYNSMLLRETTPEERAVTFFDGYFRDGRAELDRLVKSLGIQASEAAIEEACKSSKEGLRHSVTTIADLEKVSAWPGLATTYCKLLVESGEVTRETLAAEWDKVQLLASRWTLDDCCVPIVTTGHEVQRRLVSLMHELDAKTQATIVQTERYTNRVSNLEAALARVAAERDAVAAARAAVASERDAVVVERDAVAAENQAIRASKTWKIMTRLGAVAAKTGLVKPA